MGGSGNRNRPFCFCVYIIFPADICNKWNNLLRNAKKLLYLQAKTTYKSITYEK